MNRRNVKVLSTGISLPLQVLFDYQLDERLGLPQGETLRATGVHKRHQSTNENAAQIGAMAAPRPFKIRD